MNEERKPVMFSQTRLFFVRGPGTTPRHIDFWDLASALEWGASPVPDYVVRTPRKPSWKLSPIERAAIGREARSKLAHSAR